MICTCGKEMEQVYKRVDARDFPVYYLYVCVCGRVCKEDVWKNANYTWLELNGTISVQMRLNNA